ncbi:hypothetical protein [Pseudomonas matsuisoli]|uniref:Type II secretion system protein C (GspC) n=1 Tax=Pseudomonas matsuisoli TaxID=1515666 RepID=A0A917Q3N3_9PSED|nr:hypothetical protein [Pseudomonas matsuisoli]GGK07220.1 hypothetical protein GCM10009304_36830 [Pseudomonas matsuisoli]
MSVAWARPLAVRGLIAIWVLIAAWLGARLIAEMRTLALPVTLASAPVAMDTTDPWLTRHWSVNQSGDLPLTRLPIQWLGAIRALPVDGSVVVLGYLKRQYTLTIGQEIAPELVLAGIDEQGLVLDNEGRRERLLWPAPKAMVGLVEFGSEQMPAPVAATPRERLDLDSLLKRIQATPVLDDGSVIGYRLQPGAEPTLFARLGLKPGDVLRRIDEISVADTTALMKRMPQWREADSMILELEREGHPLTLAVELSL